MEEEDNLPWLQETITFIFEVFSKKIVLSNYLYYNLSGGCSSNCRTCWAHREPHLVHFNIPSESPEDVPQSPLSADTF